MPARAPFGFDASVKRPRALATRPPQPKSVRFKESAAQKRDRVLKIAAELSSLYGGLECPLSHRNHFELLAAVILSAQCTDAAVNKVTPALFERYPNPAALAAAELHDIESCIRTLGLFRAKAKALKRCAQQLVKEFNSAVPSTMDELTSLAGVGRKTANVMLGHAFGQPGIAVDTHCKRLSRRLALTRAENPVKVEQDLAKILPPEYWTDFSHQLIIHGRHVCGARKPACERCTINRLCPSMSVT